MTKSGLMMFAMLICTSVVLGQQKVFIGKLTDSTGAPIRGASVTIQGHRTGVITGDDGSFQLKANNGDILNIAALNYKNQSFSIGTESQATITLSAAATNLDEVVVTAMGIRRDKNTLPYAAQQISGDQMAQTAANSNPLSTLSGKVAGLQITQQSTLGGSTNVILRGVKSLTQNNQALFVIDGVPYDNTPQSTNGVDLGNAGNDIDPSDIASVTVLKGPAASALYGSRASNGVIMITTKKGSRGLNVGVTLGGNLGYIDGTTLPKYQTQYGGGYYTTWQDYATYNGVTAPVGQFGADASTGPAFDGSQVYQWDAFVPGGANYQKTTTWQYNPKTTIQNFLQHPVNSSVGVSVNGANDKGYFKMNYVNDYGKGMIPNSNIKKNMLTFGASYALLSNLKVSGQITYNNTAGQNRNAYAYSASGQSVMRDVRQWWQTNVGFDDLKNEYYNSGGQNMTWNWASAADAESNVEGSITTPAYHDNPYWAAYKDMERDSRDRYFGRVQIDYDIYKDLSFMARVARDSYDQTAEFGLNKGGVDISQYWRYNTNYSEMNYDFLFNYHHDINNDWSVKGLLGSNIRRQDQYQLYATTDGGMEIADVFTLSNTINQSSPTETQWKRGINGIFAGGTLDYKKLLTLDATIRRDVSSTLPKANNTFYYPSFSLNFQFGKLLRNWNWLSNAKAWANYAIVGNDAPVYSTQNYYQFINSFNNQAVLYNPTTNANPNLKPEKTKSAEVGLEASFLHNRIGFTADYYDARTVDQIMPSNVSASTGYTAFFVNGGTMQNKGVEVSLNATPVLTKNFSWEVTVNWSKNIQKVLSLYGGSQNYTVATYQNSIRLQATVGKAYQLQGSDYEYVNGQKEIDADGYYVLKSNQYSNLGTPNPTWIGGIRNNFTYKNVTLGFLIDVRKGGSLYSLDMDYGSVSGLYPRTAGINANGVAIRTPIAQGGGIILDGVHADGSKNTTYVDESDVNGETGGYTFSSSYNEAAKEFVYDAGYIKLREVSLNYNFPKSVYSKLSFVKGLNFSLTGRNLWIIHKNVPYADPEQGQASGNASMGYQNGAYPNVRELGAQLKVNF
ncbi:SusC/RagA family TonB-linked outer membrane protein [Rhizosphaericola mali]|nr:SusC/RagA family TonB-linked outer membrane protein [Rhizosphaericola mali]